MGLAGPNSRPARRTSSVIVFLFTVASRSGRPELMAATLLVSTTRCHPPPQRSQQPGRW
jgi:hypothetical protein